jgi:transcriptional regulator with XRE-family HTH domain
MTESQARQLGKLIARARERKGWSIRQVAREIGADPAWILKVERGDYASPAPELLARVAEALDIDAERMDRITRGHVSGNLPEVRTYFRAKFDLPDAAIGQIEELVAELRDEHGGDGARS